MPAFQQGFAWWPFAGRGQEPEALLAGAARIGYRGVDLLDEALWPLAAKHGLQLTAIQGHTQELGLCEPADGTTIQRESRERIAKAVKHGIPVLICFTGNRAGRDKATLFETCAETLAKLASTAADAGVTLAVELFNSKVDHPDYLGDHVEFGVRLCKAVNSPAVRLLYDIYHMQIMDGDIIRTIKEHHRWFCHYHTAGNPGRGQPDVTQELHYPAIYRAIAATGYTGFVAHEFYPPGDPLEALASAYRDAALTP